jgi:hypothetical protein
MNNTQHYHFAILKVFWAVSQLPPADRGGNGGALLHATFLVVGGKKAEAECDDSCRPSLTVGILYIILSIN